MEETAYTDAKWGNLSRAVREGRFPDRCTILGYTEIATRESAKGRPLPTVEELKDRWESWRQVCQELGFRKPSGRKLSASRAHSVKSIQRCARDQNTDVLRRSDYLAWQAKHPGAPTLFTILEIFHQSWQLACQAAGIRAARLTRSPSDDATVEMIIEVIERTGATAEELSARFYDRNRPKGAASICAGTISENYGGGRGGVGGWAVAKRDTLRQLATA